MARSMKLACVVLVMCMVVVIAPMAESDISCADVIKEFSSCLTYLEAPDNNASPSTQCCGGVKKLLDAATTTADRQAACKCLKSAAGSISKLNTNNAAALPGKCGVSIPYKISTSTNCYNIKF
ncbi:non-specific lipid-transfer protein 2-like [Vicia villosa]|uniref:non-specific lipid-transfer protein 2-like n=1 Tax=Vicia villosa TaxID=3911 RepID=UPI00273C3549|nr:non-specific lipid-transfer protein 2-like [Vicia villosa]